MLLDLEPIKKSILTKIEEKNFNFDENEFVLFNIDIELRYSLYKKLKENPQLFTYDLGGKLIDNFSDFSEDVLEDLELLFMYGKATISGGDYYLFHDIIEYLNDAQAKEFTDYYLDLISDLSDIELQENVTERTLELFLNVGKTDFLYRIEYCKELSDTMISRLKDYAKTVDKVPHFFAQFYKKLDLDYSKYSADGLLRIFNISNNASRVDGKEELEHIYHLICEKLNSGEHFDIELFKSNLRGGFICFDKNNVHNLVEILINTIGTDNEIINSLGNYINECEDLIIEKFIPTWATNSSFGYQSYGYYYWNNEFLKNKNILEKLIDIGRFDIAVHFSDFLSYAPLVIERLKLGEQPYQKIVIQENASIKKDTELLQLLSEHNMIDSISFYENDFWNSKLAAIALNEIKKGREVKLTSGCYAFPDVLETVIKSKNFKTLLNTDLNQLSNASLSEASINIIIEELKTNISLADKILLSARSLIFQNRLLLNFYLQSNEYLIEKVIDRINHEESLEYCYNEEVYNLIKSYYAEKYSLNLVHLDAISSKFGMKIIRYLDNETISKLVNLSDEEFNKFIDLFSDEKMDLNDLSNIYDSLMQYKFSKEHPEVVGIFADIMHSLDDQNDIYIKKIEELYCVFSDKFYDKFEEVYPNLVDIIKSDPRQFMLYVIEKIQSQGEERDKYIEVLHFITNYYIANQREIYRDRCNMYAEKSLAIPYSLNTNDLERKLIEYCLNDIEHRSVIKAKMVEFGLDEELADRCILYFLSKKDKSFSDKNCEVRILDTSEIKFSIEEVEKIRPYLRNLSLISREYIKVMPRREEYINRLDMHGMVERVYRMPSKSSDVYQLLIGLNVNALQQTLGDCDAYESLRQVMNKYHLHCLPSSLKDLLESEPICISGDYSNLSGFISYYDKIYEAEKSRLESQGKSVDNISLKPVNIFIYSEVYSSVSNVYSQILGSLDARLIKSNPEPNRATRKTAGNTRLNEAVERTVNNFRRMSVTVPTFAENVSMDNGKSMYVVVGNFTSPINLTHGERTGACMRIGGVGESLFQFCLDNENGFHIRFENPTTGEYISRVSGFRNGNTVFLNELRYSCNQEDYSNEDVVEACRKVAEMLIEKSRDSSYPIENVVVHTAYAVNSVACPSTNLGVSNIKAGLPHFYSDVSSNAHVLATTATGSKFVPINFDKSKVPTYLPTREKARESADLKEIIDMINRVAGVKALLAGQSLDSIEPKITNTSFIYGIASNDWYIYIDSDLVIHEDVISIDERAKGELEIARKRVEEMLPTIEKQQAYSY